MSVYAWAEGYSLTCRWLPGALLVERPNTTANNRKMVARKSNETIYGHRFHTPQFSCSIYGSRHLIGYRQRSASLWLVRQGEANNNSNSSPSCDCNFRGGDAFRAVLLARKVSTYLSTLWCMRWLSSRVVSLLGSGAEGPGFKSQPRCYRVTVLGKLFTPIVLLFTKQRNW